MKLTLWQKIKLYKLATDKAMLSKLTSRKMWASAVTAAAVVIGNHLGVPNDILTMVVQVVSAFIIGQAAVDTATAIKKS